MRPQQDGAPYVYRIDDSGQRNDNPDYATDGFYYDALYKGISMEIEPSVA